MPRLALFLLLLAAAPLPAQTIVTNAPPDTPADAPSRFVSGLDIQARIRDSFVTYTSPGKRAVSAATTGCNVGTVDGIWNAVPSPDHPVICQMICRLHDGRLEQISGWSFVKHAFSSTNTTECGIPGCVNPGGVHDRLLPNCSDTYGAPANSNHRRLLGPPWEVNPFTGEWTMLGSFFDRGYPDAGPPSNTDGQQDIWGINPTTNTQFRCEIDASVLGTPGATYFAQIHYIHKWEPLANRSDNLSSYPVSIGPDDTPGTTTATGAFQFDSVLHRHPDARVTSVDNIDGSGLARDGRFYVAASATLLADGWYHYEFAVHNRDNHGRCATFRVPLCPTGRFRDAGFKDVDADSANDWTILRQGNLLVWDAPLGNAQPWNTIYNFWFDADAAPADGLVELVQALPQHGAAPVLTVASDVPTRQHHEFVAAGCGGPVLWPDRPATIPNPDLEVLVSDVAAGATCALLLSGGLLLAPVPDQCLYMVPDIPIVLTGVAVAGVAPIPLPVPADLTLEGLAINAQALEVELGGPLLGIGQLTNVVRMRFGNHTAGCP